jgi:hypothetical protein
MTKPSKSELFIEHIKVYTDFEQYCDDVFIHNDKVFYHQKKPMTLLLTYTHQKFLLDLKGYTRMFGLTGPYEYMDTEIFRQSFPNSI